MLCDEILTKYFYENEPEKAKEIVETESYRALVKIKRVLENDDLSDAECFNKIEEIVNIFEAMGSGCGNRHDFG